MKHKIHYVKSHMIGTVILLLVVGLGLGVIYFIKTPYPVVLTIRKVAFPVTVEKGEKEITLPSGDKKIQNLKYPSHNTNNTYDLYIPKKPKKNKPLIIWTHGGGFVGGDKSNINGYGEQLVKNGYYFIAINYQLAPQALYPTPIIQLGQLVTYLQTNNTYNLNMDNVYFAGDSAGGQISAQYVAIQSSHTYSNLTNIKPTIDRSKIKGVLLYSGVYDIKAMSSSGIWAADYIYDNIAWAYLGTEHWRNSPLATQIDFLPYISSTYPPTFITDGNIATFTSQAKDLQKRLESNNVKVDSLFFPPTKIVMHVYNFNMTSFEGQVAFDRTLKFLDKTNK